MQQQKYCIFDATFPAKFRYLPLIKIDFHGRSFNCFGYSEICHAFGNGFHHRVSDNEAVL
jgi:hypothetical protein